MWHWGLDGIDRGVSAKSNDFARNLASNRMGLSKSLIKIPDQGMGGNPEKWDYASSVSRQSLERDPSKSTGYSPSKQALQKF